jgi:hypothetical protein
VNGRIQKGVELALEGLRRPVLQQYNILQVFCDQSKWQENEAEK